MNLDKIPETAIASALLEQINIDGNADNFELSVILGKNLTPRKCWKIGFKNSEIIIVETPQGCYILAKQDGKNVAIDADVEISRKLFDRICELKGGCGL